MKRHSPNSKVEHFEIKVKKAYTFRSLWTVGEFFLREILSPYLVKHSMKRASGERFSPCVSYPNFGCKVQRYTRKHIEE